MVLGEVVREIRRRAEEYPYIIAIDGTIGSGKSYDAERLHEALGGNSLLMSMDLFVRVRRCEWDERIEQGHIVLRQWYDIKKVNRTFQSIKERKKFKVSSLYNLANGEIDKEMEIDASACKYFILEGLFSCDDELDGLIDLIMFINVSPEVSLNRAEARDEAARHLSHRGWIEKKKIFFDGYLPYLKVHRKKADLILEPD
jgi:uridine kinase